ncbi:MAG: glycosyltransferase [Alphaproteobacteria bacterium]|nr:glycosyltransferase [Alphaproteobacteria bacterium]
MKVLHVGESVMGGVGTYINELASLQVSLYGAKNVQILVPYEHRHHISNPALKHIFTFSRPNRKFGLLYLVVEFVKILRTFKPDIVHAQSTIAGFVVRPLCLFWRIPVVYCPHGWATDMEQGAFKKKAITHVERVLSHITARIVAISDYEREQGIKLGIPAHKLVTVYNGIAQVPPPHDPAPWQDERLKILFVGRLDRQKGIDIFLDAIAPLQDTVCARVIGGAVTGGLTVDFKPFPHVEALGWQTPAQIAAQMAAGDVVVMPSRWEGFGLVAVEAMRLSKPVIASNVGGLPEIIQHCKTGYLFPKENVGALTAMLKQVERQKLQELGVAGYKRFLAYFIADRMAKNIYKLYGEIVGTPSKT